MEKKNKVKMATGTKKPIEQQEIPVAQRKHKVGYGNPPKEYQFKPGQSGKPVTGFTENNDGKDDRQVGRAKRKHENSAPRR